MNKRKKTFSAMPAGVHHEARVFKTGNSLAIRIPTAIAKHFELEDGSEVEIGADHAMLYIRKAPSHKAPSSDLQKLIDQITPENLHETIIENLVGKERW